MSCCLFALYINIIYYEIYYEIKLSFESHGFVTARKLKETGGLAKELPAVEEVLKQVRGPSENFIALRDEKDSIMRRMQ